MLRKLAPPPLCECIKWEGAALIRIYNKYLSLMARDFFQIVLKLSVKAIDVFKPIGKSHTAALKIQLI